MMFLWLLLLCTAGSAFAEMRCMSEEVERAMGPNKVAVVRELPKKQRGAGKGYTVMAASEGDDEWQPIRVHVSSKDLSDEKKYCAPKSGGKYEPRPDFWGKQAKCGKDSEFTEAKKSVLMDQVIPEAIRLHSDRLLVRPVKGNLVLPDLARTACQHFTVPPEHTSSGVSGADMVLYVAATPAFTAAKACATLENGGRPVAVGMTFASRHTAFTHEIVRDAAHHLAHALGFNYETMNALNMIKNVSGVRGKTTPVSMIITAKTKEKAQQHYNCSTAEGMELEDEGRHWSHGAHWERRNAKDDMMNVYRDVSLYTAITMAFFEDLGYFKANWGMEEHMSWGFGAGCDFLNKKCIQDGRNVYRNMFCTEEKPTLSCSSDRLYVGKCGIQSYGENELASSFKYFSTRSIAGEKHSLLDYCPIVSDRRPCTNPKSQAYVKATGSRVGPDSRCLTGDSLEIDGISVGDVCAEVRCAENRKVEVRYLGDDEYYECPEGSSIEPTATFSYGKIVCPKYNEVCTVAFNGSSLVRMEPKKAKDATA